MLENSVWRQFHNDNNFREVLAGFYKVGSETLIDDDKTLYGVLKAKLTKKELKLLAMDSAKVSDEEIKSAFGLDDEELDKTKKKLYKKMIQDRVRLSFRATSVTNEDAQ